MFRRIFISIALFAASSMTAQAALSGRDLNGSPGSFEAYYDDVLNITWLTNANAGAGSIWDDGANTTDGGMTWASAQAWIGSLNATSYLGVNNWRLPTVTDTGALECNFAYTGTDCGYNVDLSTGEMAHIFYSTLGNSGNFNTGGGYLGCNEIIPFTCLTNPGPFANLISYYYWSGTTYAPDTSRAWIFNFEAGQQNYFPKSNPLPRAWAVRSGDIATPVPAAVWLFGGALGALGWIRRRQSKA